MAYIAGTQSLFCLYCVVWIKPWAHINFSCRSLRVQNRLVGVWWDDWALHTETIMVFHTSCIFSFNCLLQLSKEATFTLQSEKTAFTFVNFRFIIKKQFTRKQGQKCNSRVKQIKTHLNGGQKSMSWAWPSNCAPLQGSTHNKHAGTLVLDKLILLISFVIADTGRRLS